MFFGDDLDKFLIKFHSLPLNNHIDLLVDGGEGSNHETSRKSWGGGDIHLPYRYVQVITPSCKVCPNRLKSLACWTPRCKAVNHENYKQSTQYF